MGTHSQNDDSIWSAIDRLIAEGCLACYIPRYCRTAHIVEKNLDDRASWTWSLCGKIIPDDSRQVASARYCRACTAKAVRKFGLA